jgi:thiol-disulfide isomerase/thioredoxin
MNQAPGEPRAAMIATLVLLGAVTHAIGALAPAGPLDVTRFKGKMIYLDFWASWCAPCRLAFPFMDRLAATYPPDKFMVITVDVDKDHDKGVGWLTRIGSRLPVVYDADGAIARSYGVAEMPTTFLIGTDGRIRFTHRGFFPEREAEYRSHVESLMNEK